MPGFRSIVQNSYGAADTPAAYLVADAVLIHNLERNLDFFALIVHDAPNILITQGRHAEQRVRNCVTEACFSGAVFPADLRICAKPERRFFLIAAQSL